MRLCSTSLISLALFILRESAHLKSISYFPPLANVWLFHWKTNPLIKLTVSAKYLQGIITFCNLTHILFSSIVDLKQNKPRVFSKGWMDEKMKSWVILTQTTILLHFPFQIIEKLTLPPSIWIFYLTDHQIKILKKRKCERFLHFQFPRCHVLCLRDTFFYFL